MQIQKRFMKGEVYNDSSLETGGTPHQAGPHRESPGWVRGKKEQEKIWQESLLWFPCKGMDEAGEVGLGLASLNNFCWAV